MLQQAIRARRLHLRQRKVDLETDALLRISGGDGRKLLNLLGLVVQSVPPSSPAIITDEAVLSLQQICSIRQRGEQR